jgi:cytochrome c oxidase subunit 3
MSHVPPGSLWPLLIVIGLTVVPFGVVSLLGAFKGSGWGPLEDPATGKMLIAGGGLMFLFSLMGWASQNIREKLISHDVVQAQKDLQFFILLFLLGELAAFGAVFAYFYHRHHYDPTFGPLPGMHFGGPLVAYATFLLLLSSLTCEIAHHQVEKGRINLAKFMLAATIALGIAFLGFQGYEWGELIQKGFTPATIGDHGAASFAATFYIGTGFHGLHVAIGLVMLFMVLMRLELGHFQGKRHFSLVAASWYWHFVDIVWVLLFITIYVVGG